MTSHTPCRRLLSDILKSSINIVSASLGRRKISIVMEVGGGPPFLLEHFSTMVALQPSMLYLFFFLFCFVLQVFDILSSKLYFVGIAPPKIYMDN